MEQSSDSAEKPQEIFYLDAPNFTQIPNKFVDELMPRITELSEMKVALALFRLTFGWHRQNSLMLFNLSDLKKVGLERSTVHRGLELARRRGYVYRVKVGTERGKPTYAYGLRIATECAQAVIYDIRNFKKFDGVYDARRICGTVQPDDQSGERLFTELDSTVQSDGQSATSSIYMKDSKHTHGANAPAPGVRVRSRSKKHLPSLPSSPVTTKTLCPHMDEFLTDERIAAARSLWGLTPAQARAVTVKWERSRRSKGDYRADWGADWENYVEQYVENHAGELKQERYFDEEADGPRLSREEIAREEQARREAWARQNGRQYVVGA